MSERMALSNEMFAQIAAAVDDATAGMTEEQLGFRPEGKWSTCDVLEHLALTYGGTVKGIQKRIVEGPQGGSPTMKQLVGHLLVLEMGVFPFKRKSPEQVAPRGSMCGTDALALLKKNLSEMDAAFGEYKAKQGTAGRIANHPILGPLTFGQWHKFHLNHALHHMEQIAELRTAQGLSRGI